MSNTILNNHIQVRGFSSLFSDETRTLFVVSGPFPWDPFCTQLCMRCVCVLPFTERFAPPFPRMITCCFLRWSHHADGCDLSQGAESVRKKQRAAASAALCGQQAVETQTRQSQQQVRVAVCVQAERCPSKAGAVHVVRCFARTWLCPLCVCTAVLWQDMPSPFVWTLVRCFGPEYLPQQSLDVLRVRGCVRWCATAGTPLYQCLLTCGAKLIQVMINSGLATSCCVINFLPFPVQVRPEEAMWSQLETLKAYLLWTKQTFEPAMTPAAEQV